MASQIKNKYDTDNLAPMLQVHLPLQDVENPSDTDVLCGRGGAALRHPGNQTYRRLVHLNKGLYITCLKAEKLKISRSIVAAIRDQQGRFLERNLTKGTWFDIGDKKAIEKTSQALREGQPKLRQKIVELGGGAAGAAALLEHQYSNGHQGCLGFNGGSGGLGGFSLNGSAPNYGPSGYDTTGFHSSNTAAMHLPPEISSNASSLHMHRSTGGIGGPGIMSRNDVNSCNDMPPPPPQQPASDSPLMGMGEELLQRLSLTETNGATSGSQAPVVEGSSTPHDMTNHMVPSLTQRGQTAAQALGVDESTLNLMSNISTNCGMPASAPTSSSTDAVAQAHAQAIDVSPPNSGQHPPLEVPQNPVRNFQRSFPIHKKDDDNVDDDDESDVSDDDKNITLKQKAAPADANASSAVKIDRRRFFAKMKYRGAGSQRSLTSGTSDGMPDIHLVESNRSLVSGMSESTAPEREGGESTPSKSMFGGNRGTPSLGDVFAGSRRSLMSGLSKISDSTEGNSIISDLSKKIGPIHNVSTRSLLSEISGMDESESIDTRDIPQPTPIAPTMCMD